MPKREEPEFTVTDRRKFTAEGEPRTETPAETESPSSATRAATQATASPQSHAEKKPSAQPPTQPPEMPEMPPAPTAAEQQAQHDAFKESAKQLDEKIQQELGGRRSMQDFEMSFERFIASLYMTAMLQLGLMVEQGARPQVDLIGARQTIDTIGLLSDKTKGNLTMAEQNLLQNSLYELRMAYVEVTNALARGPQAPPPGNGPKVK